MVSHVSRSTSARAARPPRPSRGARPEAAEPGGAPPTASARFRDLDPYRAAREWARYEGTAQRSLWRELRERFLERHQANEGWVLDVGSGPGRFTPRLGGPASPRVALDLSREMLALLGQGWRRHAGRRPLPHRVIGNGARPPFASAAFAEVALLGNALGFSEAASDRLWAATLDLVAPGGTFVVEIAPGAGERSRYLARLPATSVARLLRSPIAAVRLRLAREGFAPEPTRRKDAGAFRRYTVAELSQRLAGAGWEVLEVSAVAPALGADAERIAAAERDSKAWAHLVELEEQLGRVPERWGSAAAVLIAARRPRLETRH